METAPAAASTSSHDRRTSFSAGAVSRSDRGRATAEQETSSSSDAIFATLVESLRVPESIGVKDIPSSLSSEVFEAGQKSTLEKQRAVSDAERRAQALSGFSDARFDRTGVQARRDKANLSASQRSAHAKRGATDGFLTNKPTKSVSASVAIPASDSASGEATTQANSVSLSTTDVGAKDTAKPENIDLVANQNAAVISTASSSAAGGMISAAGRPAVSPAQQIGQMLGLERTGASAATRSSSASAVVAPSDTGQAGSNRAQDTGGSRVLAKEDEAAPTKQADQPTPTDFSKLVRSLRMQAGEHHSSARLHLRPPELGRVIVDVRMDGDAVQIDVQAETEQGKQLLADRADQLQIALEDAGVVLDRMNVTMTIQPEIISRTDHTGGMPRPGNRLADSEVAASEDFEPWQNQPEELMAATVKATRKRLGFTDRARLDVRA